MRLIRNKIDPKITEALEGIGKRFNITDLNYLADVYCLLHRKGEGVPSVQAVVDFLAMRKGKISDVQHQVMSVQLKKRRMFLEKLSKLDIVRKAPDRTSIQFLGYLESLLGLTQSQAAKKSYAECMNCPLLSECEYGTKFANYAGNPVTFATRNELQMVHDSCPNRKQAEGIADFAEKIEEIHNKCDPSHPDYDPAFASQIQQDPLNFGNISCQESEYADDEPVFMLPSGSTTKKPALGDGSTHTTVADEPFAAFQREVDKLSALDHALVNLGATVRKILKSKAPSSKYKPTDTLSDAKQQKGMDSAADYVKLGPADLAKTGLQEDLMLASKSGRIRQDAKRVEQKRLLFVLWDVSYSMSHAFTLNGSISPALFWLTKVKRASLAAVYLKALGETCRERGQTFMYQPYSTGLGSLVEATTDAEYGLALKQIAGVRSTGSDTLTAGCLKAVAQKLSTKPGAIPEILLITDGDDKHALDKPDLKGIPLHVLEVGPKPNPWLRKIADSYFRIDGSSNNLSEALVAVSGL